MNNSQAPADDKRSAWIAEAKQDALIEEAKDFAERMTGQPWACELVERLLDALTSSRAECEGLRALLLEANETMLAPRAAYGPLTDKIEAAIRQKETGNAA